MYLWHIQAYFLQVSILSSLSGVSSLFKVYTQILNKHTERPSLNYDSIQKADENQWPIKIVTIFNMKMIII